MRVLLTGATGFVGKHMLAEMKADFNVVVLGRKRPNHFDGEFIECELENVGERELDLSGVDVVVHSAARAHVMNDDAPDPLSAYRKINTEATIALANQAYKSGVKRFIFISSIKVNGESSAEGSPFQSTDEPKFNDFYGQSKYEAEKALAQLAQETGLEVVIIRPTLIYGPGVKANFAALFGLVSKGLPLPFGCVTNNKRSLVSVYNLVDLILTCVKHPEAANQVFLVSDDNDVSTAQMVKEMAAALDKRALLLPIPVGFFSLAGKLFNKSDVANRLVGSLQVDIRRTKEILGWAPPMTLQNGFKKTADAFNKTNQTSGKV